MATPTSDEIEAVDGIAVRSGKIEFDASELRPCGQCRRANAPNRAECIYCGAGLAPGDVSAELKLREVEPWERAYNVVLVGGQVSDSVLAFPIDPGILRRVAELRPPTPVARVATSEAAELMRSKMEELGMSAAVLSDEGLAADRPPIRLRSLNVEDERIVVTAFNTGERTESPADLLELIVVGRRFEEREEQTLKRNRKGVKEMDARNVSKDTGVIDIYLAGAADGFRILESGFDFSCLGDGKSLLATENMAKIVDLLKSFARHAAVSSDYASKRKLLDEVWPSQIRNDSKGVQRSGFSVSMAKAEVTSNTEQFTKYSRLVRRRL